MSFLFKNSNYSLILLNSVRPFPKLLQHHTARYVYSFCQLPRPRLFSKFTLQSHCIRSQNNGIFQYKTLTSKTRNFWTNTSSQQFSQQTRAKQDKNLRSTLYYVAAIGVLVFGLSYAAVPLYRIFCQAYSYGGTVQHDTDGEKVAGMAPVKDRKITINFNADTGAMVWNFKPLQRKLELLPGETALAFYSARNPTDRPVVGISTYNVLPFEAGQYFNKIQCFCFEEQMLNPNEEVQMPVFFYIDPEFADDPAMDNVDNITLSYTFFEAKPGMEIPLPGFMKK